MHHLDWAFIGYCIYVPLLLALYLLEIIVIVQHRKKTFNSSFFRVFSVLAVVNIVASLLGCFVFRMPLYPLVNGVFRGMTEDSRLLTAAYTGSYYLNCVSELLGVLLALNRFTALYAPLQHDKFWRWFRFMGVILCLLVAVAPVWYLVDDANMFVEVVDPRIDFKWYYLNAVSDVPEASIWFNMVIVTVVCNGTSFLLYAACLIRLWLFSVSRNFTAERNFFLVGFLSMLFSLPFMAAMLIFGLNLSVPGAALDFDTLTTVAYQLPWLTDLKFLTPAPMLLLTNKTIRTAIKKVIKRQTRRIISAPNVSQGSKRKTTQVTPRV